MRKILFWSHLVVGCIAGLVILILSVTGVLLAYERQVIAWVDRDLRHSPSREGAGHAQMGMVLEKLREQQSSLPTAFTMRRSPDSNVEATFGRDRVLYLDPRTGALLGEGSSAIRRFFHSVEDWHRWLALSNANRATGRAVTGACNLAFLGLILSGPFLWLPKRWSWQHLRPIVVPRWGVMGRARDFNWHNSLGIWSAVPLFLIVVSGAVMSYPWANALLYRVTGSEMPAVQGPGGGPRGGPDRNAGKGGSGPARPQAPAGAFAPPPANLDLTGLDGLWERATQQTANWQSISLRLPQNDRAPLIFTIDAGEGGRPDQRAQLTLHRETGEVLRWEPFSSYSLGRQMRSWVRFGHTGEAGGWLGQTVAAAASAGGVLLVWTGFALAWRRWSRWQSRRNNGNMKTNTDLEATGPVLTSPVGTEFRRQGN